MTNNPNTGKRYVEAIRQSGLSIYDPIEIGDSDLWIPTNALEALLNNDLRGRYMAYSLEPAPRS